MEIPILNRFPDLYEILVDSPVQDVQRFLSVVNRFNIADFFCPQPQDLFDRLPEHCAIQDFFITYQPEDLRFLFKLKNSIRLSLGFTISLELISEIFKELPFLSHFSFKYDYKWCTIETGLSKVFEISISHGKIRTVSNVDAAIHHLIKSI